MRAKPSMIPSATDQKPPFSIPGSMRLVKLATSITPPVKERAGPTLIKDLLKSTAKRLPRKVPKRSKEERKIMFIAGRRS